MEYISLLIAPLNINGVTVSNQYINIESPLYKIEEKQTVKQNDTSKTPLVIATEKPVVTPQPTEPTLEEKIESNYYKCTENQWIRADNAECLDKPVYTTPSGYNYTVKTNQTYNTVGNNYSYGYCTWYVKNRRPDIPNSLGNANEWLYNAQAYGFSTGSSPVVGAVAQTSAGGLGHVAYVEAVYGDGKILVSEMNYQGWNILSTRVTSASEFNYIY